MTVPVPYDWLRHLPASLFAKEDVPFFGHPPPFPWEQFSALFTKVFQLKEAKFTPSAWQMRAADELYEGLGSSVVPHFIDLAPLSGNLCFVIAEEELQRLMKLFLLGDPNASTMIDADYQQGFNQFLVLEIFNIFTMLDYAKGVMPHLLETLPLPSQPSVCQDVTIEIQGLTFVGRLIISDKLRFSWKERYAQQSLTVSVPAEIEVVVQLEAGHVSLSKPEWDQLEVGDFLFLDQCSLENGGEKGRVIMTLYGKPIYRARVKEGQLKILESPFYHEIETKMSPLPDQEEEDTLSGTFDEEFSDFEDEFTDFEETSASHTIEEETAETTIAEQAVTKEIPPQEEKIKPAAPPPAAPLNISEIPLTVVIEVGRIQISLQKLMELQPGNVLELDIHPEKSVDLVVNGRIIGRGELLKLGNSLGVRILDKA